MTERHLTQQHLADYRQYLITSEHSSGTVDKYLRDVRAFSRWLSHRNVTKTLSAAWKDHLLTQGYAPATVNSMLAALNGLFRFLTWDDCRVKFVKIQRRIFRDPARELTCKDYQRLVTTARRQGQERLALLMEAICATGIRVSEVKYLTVEAARCGRTDIALKGKVRTILLPGKLCRKLLKYAKKQKTVSGEIFLTKNGTSLHRHQIWRELKRLCRQAGVEPSKVFPHNFRHLFAVTFYHTYKDVVRLADVLGHADINTTRLYLVSSGAEHQRQLDQLGFVS